MDAEAAPVVQSKLAWFLNSLGLFYTGALLAAGLLAFILTIVIVARGRGPLAGAALWFAVTLPLWVGVLGFFDGMIASFTVIAMSEVSPKPSEVASGISTSLVTPLVGLWLMAPSFVVATIGSLIRAMTAPREQEV